MRIPIFAQGSNPAIDRFLVKKSAFYVAELISTRRAAWLDPAVPGQGCILLRRFNMRDEHVDSLNHIAGSGFDSAWSIRPSGYGGPSVWQLKTSAAMA